MIWCHASFKVIYVVTLYPRYLTSNSMTFMLMYVMDIPSLPVFDLDRGKPALTSKSYCIAVFDFKLKTPYQKLYDVMPALRLYQLRPCNPGIWPRMVWHLYLCLWWIYPACQYLTLTYYTFVLHFVYASYYWLTSASSLRKKLKALLYSIKRKVSFNCQEHMCSLILEPILIYLKWVV